jgi:hypothetical protein
MGGTLPELHEDAGGIYALPRSVEIVLADPVHLVLA